MAIIKRRYVRNQLDVEPIKGAVDQSAAIVAVSPSHADLSIDDTVADAAEMLDDYMMQVGYRFLSASPASPLVAFYGASLVVDNPVAIVGDATFDVIGGVITNPAFFADNPAMVFGRITGAYKVTGGTAEFKIVECNPDGSNPMDKLPAVTLVNTLGSWALLGESTANPPRAGGPWEYSFQARLNGSTGLEFKYVSMSLMELATP